MTRPTTAQLNAAYDQFNFWYDKAKKLDEELAKAEERIAELEAKLATPVRLQSSWVDKVGNRWLLEGTTADAIRASGFAVTVEGDEQ